MTSDVQRRSALCSQCHRFDACCGASPAIVATFVLASACSCAMVRIVAEFSYYASGSMFNLQFGPYRNILLCVQEFLGDHYGAGLRHNVMVLETNVAGRYMLAVIANSRFNMSRIGGNPNARKSSSDYLEIAQQRVWHIHGH